MAKAKPTVALRKPPVADADRFVGAGSDVQEHSGTQARKRTSAKRGARATADGQQAAPPEERARLHCLIAADLHRWLRFQAIDEGRDMGEIVAEALERYRATSKPKR